MNADGAFFYARVCARPRPVSRLLIWHIESYSLQIAFLCCPEGLRDPILER